MTKLKKNQRYKLMGLYCENCEDITIIDHRDTWDTHGGDYTWANCPQCGSATNNVYEVTLPARGYRLGVVPPQSLESQTLSSSLVGSKVYPSLNEANKAARETSPFYVVEILAVLDYQPNHDLSGNQKTGD